MMKPIQDRISSLFYFHGLFCASHPFATIAFVIAIIIGTCYPLSKLPWPGNAPLEYTSPLAGYEPPTRDQVTSTLAGVQPKDFMRPRWYYGMPLAYVQQIIVKATVSPWNHKSLIPTDGIRSTLHQVFSLLDELNNLQHKAESGSVSVGDVCLHITETVHQQLKEFLPEYGCLIISPANLWKHSEERFSEDGHIMKTVHKKFGQPLDASPSVTDILFGLAWKDTGVPRFSQFYVRNRQRIISFAVTLVLREYNPEFMAVLEGRLRQSFPLEAFSNTSQEALTLVHVHFRDVNYFVEYTPLLVAYLVLFLYLYFSVRKIEMVKSKSGLAFSAVFVVMASLLMSIGIVTFFGMTPSLNGSEIFPYLVVIIGLENVLVVTRSVVNTPVHLEVRYRVAEGLSKEGWSIFKNLMTEFFILAVGFLSMVPAIQEFCLFAVVGLATDFFLQMVFFTTVLSIDIRRMELSDLQKQAVYQSGQLEGDPVVTPTQPSYCPVVHHSRLTTSKSASHLEPPPSPTSQDAYPGPIMKLPRRLRFLFFWARTRILQRMMMIALIVWSLILSYTSGVLDQLVEMSLSSETSNSSYAITPVLSRLLGHPTRPSSQVANLSDPSYAAKQAMEDHKRVVSQLHHDGRDTWRHLSYMHWPTLFSFYNISLRGRYITLLPSIHISSIVRPEDAVTLRHPSENAQQDLPDTDLPPDTNLFPTLRDSRWARAMVPQTNIELVFTLLFLLATMLIFMYFLVMLYKIVCSRNYAKWRSSWPVMRRARRQGQYKKEVRESLPIILQGHTQEVECVTTDGPFVISTCLGGQIRVWDSNSGECLTVIHRRSCIPHVVRAPALGRNMDDGDADLYAEYHEPVRSPGHAQHQPSSDHNMHKPRPPPAPKRKHTRYKSADWALIAPDLSASIDTNFASQSLEIQTRAHRANSDPSQLLEVNVPGRVCSTSSTSEVFQDPYAHRSSTSSLSPTKVDTTHSFHNDTLQTLHTPSYYSGNSPRTCQGSSPDACGATLGTAQGFSPCDTGPQELGPGGSPSALGTAIPWQGRRGSQPGPSPQRPAAFDFSHFEPLYREHWQSLGERQAYLEQRARQRQSLESLDGSLEELADTRAATQSLGNSPHTVEFDATLDSNFQNDTAPPIWCLACQDNLIVAGCGNGRIEIWDGLTGALKCLYEDCTVGVTNICLVGNKVIVGRMSGYIDFLELETFVRPPHVSTTQSGPRLHKRGHARRLSSHGSMSDMKSWDDIIHCHLVHSVRAHQQPISHMQSAAGRLVSGSHDHRLKVYRLEDQLGLYTLHGHKTPITALFLDKVAPLAAVSGAQDGSLRLWDLLTGMCVHTLKSHTEAITDISATAMHVVSIGMDDKMCIWERPRGHLLHCIEMHPGQCNSVTILPNNKMVTGGQGYIYLWDTSKGDIMRSVQLTEHSDAPIIRQVAQLANSAVVCNFGCELRVVHFNIVLEKAD